MAPKRKREDMDCDPDDQAAAAMEKLAGEWLDWRVLYPRRAPNLTTYLFKRRRKNEQQSRSALSWLLHRLCTLRLALRPAGLY